MTYITSYMFVLCSQVCGKLSCESQDKLCDLQVMFVPCVQVCGNLFESQDKLCDLQVTCLPLVYRCVESCLSHRTCCVTYITRYVFVPCAQVCGKLFESQDMLCDLQVTFFFPCAQVCGKLFESQDKLEIHRQVHLQSSNGTFTCPHCGEICKKWRPFLYHLSKHQADGGKKYTCQV